MDRDWRPICDEFLRCTSYSLDEWDLWDERPAYDPASRPPTYLSFPDAAVRIPLGPPELPAAPPLWEVLRNRRSKRAYLPEPITLQELNALLWASTGVTADMGDYQIRTAPSSGATYPTETYLLVNAVDGLQPGVWHLDVKGWTLELVSARDDIRTVGCHAANGQEAARESAVNFVWTSVLERCRVKYHERTYRYIWWDVGHISQNMLLAATALDLGACVMGSWFDDELAALCQIDGKEHVPVLFATVGRVKGLDWREDRRPTPKKDPPKKRS